MTEAEPLVPDLYQGAGRGAHTGAQREHHGGETDEPQQKTTMMADTTSQNMSQLRLLIFIFTKNTFQP